MAPDSHVTCETWRQTVTQNSFWKYNGKSIFLHFKHWPKLLKLKFRTEIWTFSFQIFFWWSTLGSCQTENSHIRVNTYFLFYHFLKSKIDSESRFEMRRFIFSFKTFFLKNFGNINKKVKKMDFLIVFSKRDLTGVWYNFWLKTFLKKPKFPKYA